MIVCGMGVLESGVGHVYGNKEWKCESLQYGEWVYENMECMRIRSIIMVCGMSVLESVVCQIDL